jgi:DNA polymerase III psi subunit
MSIVLNPWETERKGIIELQKDTMLKETGEKVAHVVPATRVQMWVLSSSSSLAKPKSGIFGSRSLSGRTLVVLMSL